LFSSVHAWAAKLGKSQSVSDQQFEELRRIANVSFKNYARLGRGLINSACLLCPR
jgi:hypothetical protein